MDLAEKNKRLEELAQKDGLYQFYKRMHDDAYADYRKYLRWCPRKIRRAIEHCAAGGWLMMQRMASIALEHMEFKDE